MNVQYWLRHPVEFARRLRHAAYERAHPDEPFIAPAAVRFLDKALSKDGVGLEWGSGRSTRWLAQRLRHLISVEYDPAWLDTVTAQLKQANLNNVDYRFIALDHATTEPTRPIYDPLPRYVSMIDEFPDEHFDFIEVDGHYRQACALRGMPKLKRGGLLLVDDTNWIPIEEWGIPKTWALVHQSVKINTATSIWKRPQAATAGTPQRGGPLGPGS